MPITPFSQPFPTFYEAQEVSALSVSPVSCEVCCDEFVCDASGEEVGNHVVLQIAKNTSDGVWTNNIVTDTNCEFGNVSIGDGGHSERNVWLTFANVPLTQGVSRIHKARLVLTADDDGSTGGNEGDFVYVIIRGHCSSNSTQEPENNNTPDYEPSWPRTWTLLNWNEVEHWTDDVEYYSPDVACIVAEIVSLEGWQSGNSLKLFIEELTSSEGVLSATRRFVDYNTDSTKAAKLEIWYSNVWNETPSGGVLGGGSAVVSTTYVPQIESYGVIVNGGFLEDVIVMEGGVVAGGAADVFTIASETMTGGVVCGGAAFVQELAEAYTYRRKIIHNEGTISENLNSFIFTVQTILDPDQVGPAVFQVTDLSGNRIYHDMRRYNEVTGQLHIVFRADLKTDTDTEFWLYYGRVVIE